MITRGLRRLGLNSSYWKDIGWVISGNSLANLIAIAILPWLTRLYDTEDFALQALFIQSVGFTSIVVSLRFELLIQLPKQTYDAKSILLLVILLSITSVLVMTPIAYLLSDILATLLGEAQLSVWLPLVPATAALMSLALAVQHYLQRQQRYKVASLAEIASKGSYIFVAVAGFWVLPKSAGLILAQSAASIGKLIYMLLPGIGPRIKRLKRAGITGDLANRIRTIPPLIKEHRNLSAGVVTSQLLMAGSVLLPSAYILKAYGTETLGQYALVLATIFLPSGLIGNAIGKVYYQRAAKDWGEGNPFAKLWSSTLARVAAIGIPIYFLVGATAPFMYPLVFGNSWVMAGEIAQLMALSAFVNFVTSPFATTSWIVGAWWYPIVFGALRLTTTMLTIWIAQRFDLPIMQFIWLTVAQQFLAYLFDGIYQGFFACRKVVRDSE